MNKKQLIFTCFEAKKSAFLVKNECFEVHFSGYFDWFSDYLNNLI